MRRIPFLLLVAAAFLSGGCEHDGDDSFDLTVYASNDRLHEGECCELVAHLRDDDDDSRWFGNHVTWSLSDPSIGHLSETTGRRVFYYPDRIPVSPEKELVQTVYCKYDAPLEFSHHTRRKILHLVKRHPLTRLPHAP